MSNISDRIKNEYSNRYALLVPNREFYPADADGQWGGTLGGNDKITNSQAPAYVGNVPDPIRQSLGAIWSYYSTDGLKKVAFQGRLLGVPYEAGKYPNWMLFKLPFSKPSIEFEDVSNLWNDVIFTRGMFPQTLNLNRVSTRMKMFFGAKSGYRPNAATLFAKMGFFSLITDIKDKNVDSGLQIPYFADEASADNGEASQYYITFAKSGFYYNNASTVDYENMGTPVSFGSYSPTLDEALKPIPPGSEYLIEATINGAYEAVNEIFGQAIQTTGQQKAMRSYYDFLTDTYASDNLYGTTLDGVTFGKAKEINSFRSYLDYAFGMPLPMSERALSLSNTVNKTDMVANLQSVYNFQTKYEKMTRDLSTRTFVMANGSSDKIEIQDLPSIYDVPLDDQDTPSVATEDEDSKFNFDLFYHRVSNCGYDKNYFKIEQYKNIILDQNSQQYLEKYNNIKSQFPFYANINFNDDGKRDFTTVFNETGLTMRLMRSWIMNFFKGGDGAGGLGVESSTTANRNDLISIGQYKGKYYNSDDPNQGSGVNNPPEERARICSPLKIYSIVNHQNFFDLVPPSNSEDKATIGTELQKQGQTEVLREYNLNRWLDNYIQYVAKSNGTTAESISASDPEYDYGISSTKSTYDYKLYYDNKDPIVSGYYEGTDQPIEVLQVLNFINRYKSTVDKHVRDYKEILQGKKAYSETLFYRIQKVFIKDGMGTEADPSKIVQNIWIPKPTGFEEDQKIMKYIDTQIGYDGSFEYTIYAYQLVVGSRYGFQYASYMGKEYLADYIADELGTFSEQKVKAVQYDKSFIDSASSEGYTKSGGQEGGTERLETGMPLDSPLFGSSRAYVYKNNQNPESDRLIMMDAICEPEVRLVEVPIYKKNVVVSDAASVAPNIDIVPLNRQKNKIKINFLPSSVDREQEPITILETDKEKFHKIRLSQGRELLKSQEALQLVPTLFAQIADDDPPLPNDFYVEPKLRFKSDDFPVEAEIFRLKTKPTKYTDFKNAQKTSLKIRKQASYIDKLEHNVKYYYTFRTRDLHNNPSLPSPVYQVELVENSGVVYPVVSIYQFEAQKLGNRTKSFKRYLKIDAEHLQGLLNLSESDLKDSDTAISNSNIKLGLRDDPLFNTKRFKFRIRSKHTGKLLDLNVVFKTKEIKPVSPKQTCQGTIIQSSTAKAIPEVLGDENSPAAKKDNTVAEVIPSFP